MVEWLINIDKSFSESLTTSFSCQMLDWAMPALLVLFHSIWFLLGIVIISIISGRKSPQPDETGKKVLWVFTGNKKGLLVFFQAILAALASILVCSLLQKLVGRPAPFTNEQSLFYQSFANCESACYAFDSWMGNFSNKTLSFPSIYSSVVASVFFIVTFYYRRWFVPGVFLSLFLLLARIYTGLDFAGDVLAGAGTGLIIAWIFTMISKVSFRKTLPEIVVPDKSRDLEINWFHFSLVLILLNFIVRLWFVSSGQIELVEDEAHYWEWSRRLDWSYATKGPGIAYIMWLPMNVIGVFDWALRMPHLLMGIGAACVFNRLAVMIYGDEKAGFFATLLLLGTPAFNLAYMIANLDGPFILAFLLASYYICSIHVKKKSGIWRYFLAGVFVGIGTLVKYTCFVMVPILGVYLLVRLFMDPIEKTTETVEEEPDPLKIQKQKEKNFFFKLLWTALLLPVVLYAAGYFANEQKMGFWAAVVLLGFGLFAWLMRIVLQKRFRKNPRPEMRDSFRGYLVFVQAATICSLPILIFNAKCNWFTFEHLFKLGVGKDSSWNPLHFPELLGTMMLLMTPLLMLGVTISIFRGFKFLKTSNQGEKFLFLSAAPFLCFFFIMSFKKAVYPNWVALSCIMGGLMCIGFIRDWFKKNRATGKSTKKLKTLVVISFIIAYGGTALIYTEPFYNTAAIKLIQKIKPDFKEKNWPFNRCRGGKELARKVDSLINEMPDKNRVFIYSDRYQISGILAFYCDQKDNEGILADNKLQTFCIIGDDKDTRRINQSDFWPQPDMKNRADWNGVFVKVRKADFHWGIKTCFEKYENFDPLKKKRVWMPTTSLLEDKSGIFFLTTSKGKPIEDYTIFLTENLTKALPGKKNVDRKFWDEYFKDAYWKKHNQSELPEQKP